MKACDHPPEALRKEAIALRRRMAEPEAIEPRPVPPIRRREILCPDPEAGETGIDAAEKTRTKRELRRSRDLLAEVERLAGVGSWEWDIRTDRWTFSENWLRIHGVDRDHLDSEELLRLAHPEDEAAIRAAFRDAVETTGVYDIEHRIRRENDGETRFILARGEVERDPDGTPRWMLGTARDITKKIRAEAERLELERKIKETQKLESLGVLAGGIAHDFNNILMVILGNADLAREALPEPSPVRENLVEIETACGRAAELCRQMLAYSGKGRFVVESLDLSALVSDMPHLLEASVSKKAILRLRPAEALPRMRGDAVQLRQVLVNLVVNASEAIGERSGRITVSTGARECDRAFLDRAHLKTDPPEGTYVFLRVADDGAGMDAETRRRLFEPFFTTKFLGRGLGLSAVLGIVRGHKGTLIFDSAPGEGAEFTILFPALPDSADRARP